MSLAYKYQMLPVEKVFRDPVHNYIHVNHQVILDLINSKEVQRLRRIKQLGTSSFTFHGAEHSRFSHSLGVYEITRQICDIFKQTYSIEKIGEEGWDDSQRLIALCAALLHDIGHGPYSHTFEHIFHTDHEQITEAIITSPQTEVYQILNRVEAGFPEKVASVITKTYPNPQVVQMISSQIDADRMDYLLRDAYYTGTKYGTFDLTRILQMIRPCKSGIVFAMEGMHAVEDYIVSRYQMHIQVYFHPSSRGMEVGLEHLLNRAHELFFAEKEMFQNTAQLLIPFFRENFTLEDYLRLDDGVLNTAFNLWTEANDPVLNDLSRRFLNRKPLKSCRFDPETQETLIETMGHIVEKAGFNPNYYTAINSSYDLPYDFYQPKLEKHRTQIELQQNDGTLTELSQVSQLVAALAGQEQGDHRFYFPKEMIDPKLQNDSDLFGETYRLFASHIHNGELI
ncbi:MAG: HD domain-containing protein [Tetragenococcus halophilus]|uniref:HD domain-containing protein n=1 Tax=Tetragenococcus halophilus TaxID=51669 RepID=UPI001F279209|nr:HD domain-containing protein [Tetragenococcus halophilus]MCF1676205.1 HD domain-containing protein [Tetragenococcus halophilus]MDN5831866.1 HD domain-containing protein [Tetragenococcus halophilus]MDN6113104.1 HD domain-containing protein [Tetragenococcus halophilus]MDN6129903.1 HD domain-containing protein [Tetragenococcus halophilus]MDN6142037.1 HD domain-containing protein [Tetragenococcus halophilus]